MAQGLQRSRIATRKHQTRIRAHQLSCKGQGVTENRGIIPECCHLVAPLTSLVAAPAARLTKAVMVHPVWGAATAILTVSFRNVTQHVAQARSAGLTYTQTHLSRSQHWRRP